MAQRKTLPSIPAPAADDARQRDAFVRSAPGKTVYPWQKPGVRPSIKLPVTTKIPEDLWMQVEYLSNLDEVTRMTIIEESLRDFIARRFKDLGIPV